MARTLPRIRPPPKTPQKARARSTPLERPARYIVAVFAVFVTTATDPSPCGTCVPRALVLFLPSVARS